MVGSWLRGAFGILTLFVASTLVYLVNEKMKITHILAFKSSTLTVSILFALISFVCYEYIDRFFITLKKYHHVIKNNIITKNNNYTSIFGQILFISKLLSINSFCNFKAPNSFPTTLSNAFLITS